MMANSCKDKALRDAHTLLRATEWLQGAGKIEVTPGTAKKNTAKVEGCAPDNNANSKLDSGIRELNICATTFICSNSCGINHLRDSAEERRGHKLEKNGKSLIAPCTLKRWCKFNVVGGIGVAVQFAALFLLKNILHVNYLAATALAVETAVLHNFIWHEQYTWADGTQSLRRTPSSHTAGAEAQNLLSISFAALKRCATQRQCNPSVGRLIRFHLSNGVISILGNVALMRMMVGGGHMNYLLANGVAIAVCSLANFWVSDAWVFKERA
jgi:putative flippase GtrA